MSRGVGCGESLAWAPPQKKIIFVPKNGAAFNVQKTRTITGNLAWDTDFTVQSQNEAYENSAKIIQKNHGQPGWGGHTIAPALNTPLISVFHNLYFGSATGLVHFPHRHQYVDG